MPAKYAIFKTLFMVLYYMNIQAGHFMLAYQRFYNQQNICKSQGSNFLLENTNVGVNIFNLQTNSLTDNLPPNNSLTDNHHQTVHH